MDWSRIGETAVPLLASVAWRSSQLVREREERETSARAASVAWRSIYS